MQACWSRALCKHKSISELLNTCVLVLFSSIHFCFKDFLNFYEVQVGKCVQPNMNPRRIGKMEITLLGSTDE